MKSFSYFSSLSFSSDFTSFHHDLLPPYISDKNLEEIIVENSHKFQLNSSSYKQDIWKNRINSLKNDTNSFIKSTFFFLIHKYSSIPPNFLYEKLFSLSLLESEKEEDEIFLQKWKENSLDLKDGILHQPMNIEPVSFPLYIFFLTLSNFFFSVF